MSKMSFLIEYLQILTDKRRWDIITVRMLIRMIMEGYKMAQISQERWMEILSNPKKHSPEEIAKAKSLGEKMKSLSKEELKELREKAKEKFGV